ncbi:RELT-like protein 2 [Geospiza fortis]|uniref:RELT-like protein 2 n=1 Tax=Geospiza fortis TaxID=48883 RepID=A0A6I9Z8T4_GEOFO|nr:RELT-like protein 2 [Geospiza fortis]
MEQLCRCEENFWAEHRSEDPRRSLDLGTPACLAAMWTGGGARAADATKGRGPIVCGVTFAPVAVEEKQEKSGQEIRMSDYHNPHYGESEPQHGITVVFLLVLVFFIMGLVGFLICHVLKKKGYRCRTFRDELDPDDKDEVEELDDDEAEKNDDAVEKIVRCIIQNEANVEALKEMLGENEPDVPVPVPSLYHHSSSQDGGPPHHHTVHLGSTHAPCIHCSRKKRHPLQRQGRSKEGKSRMHPGETTVFSVGRSAPGSSSRQRRQLSLPVLGASSPNIPGELAREGAGICLEEMGLASADEVSDIHGSLSLQEQAEELGRDESSRKQSGGEDGKQQEPSAAEQDRV